MKKYLSYLPGTLWALFILVLTGLPGDYFPEVSSFWEWLEPDKAVHLILFGVFTFLIMWGHRAQYREKSKRTGLVLKALILGVFYSALTEILQDVLFSGRDGNIYDFMANTIGVILGIGIFHQLFKHKTEGSTSI